jgi:endonuclease YncB( thermonuclease family)
LAAFAAGVGLGIAGGIGLATRPIGTAVAATPEPAPPLPKVAAVVGRYAVEVIRVLDGDTFEARVHVWPGFDLSTRVRLRGIDAPEMKARCSEERIRGETAQDALRAILDERGVTIAAIGPDKYSGRIVADVATRVTHDVSTALLDRRLVRAYAGGRRENWCDGSR